MVDGLRIGWVAVLALACVARTEAPMPDAVEVADGWQGPACEAPSDSLPIVDAAPGSFRVGAFLVRLDEVGGWDVTHDDEPGRSLFHVPDAGALAVLRSTWSYAERQGAVTLDEGSGAACEASFPTAARHDGRVLVLSGALGQPDAACAGLGFVVRFCEPAPHHLSLELTVTGGAGGVLRVRAALEPEEAVVGLGEQFPHDTLDLRGRSIPVLVREQGIGRGEPAISQVMQQLSPGSPGDESTTYYAAPHVLTSRNRSFFLEGDEVSVFDLTTPGLVEVRVASDHARVRVLHGTSPLELIERFSAVVGRMREPPAWLDQGAIVALAGDLDAGTARVGDLLAAGARLAAVWDQTWCGTAKTVLGEQVLWNWALPPSRRAAWGAFVDSLEAGGSRVLCYVNPMFRDLPTDADPTSRALYREALDGRFVVTTPEGEPYLLQQGVFRVALLDLSNPAARDWMKAVLHDELMGAARCSGWMADFAEALPFDAVLASGESAAAWHNRYPVEWARLQREALDDAGRLDDVLVFHRSGFTTTPAFSGMQWAGDQTVTWDRFDGLQSALHGLLNGGFSGVALNHVDAGGYTSVPLVDPPVRRSAELLERWVELSAFTAVLRTHEGNQPSSNAQVYGSDELAAHFARFSRVYRALGPYRRGLFRDAAARGWPVVRHVALHTPDVPRAWAVHDQFLLGPDVLVAPVLEASTRADGAVERAAWLPPGEWRELWTARGHQAPAVGLDLVVTSLPGFPPVFVREGSAIAASLPAALRAEGIDVPEP